MSDSPPGPASAVSLVFDADVWAQEVERYPGRSRPRVVADVARRELERSGPLGHGLRRCAAIGADNTRLSGCLKVYLPLAGSSSAEAPYGFVFRMSVTDGPPPRVVLGLLAFGERHPPPGTRSVYERAHKRLHSRYPDE